MTSHWLSTTTGSTVTTTFPVVIPQWADDLVIRKQEITGRIFHFQGGRATKVFIGIAFSAVGFVHPIQGVPGLVFAFIDP